MERYPASQCWSTALNWVTPPAAQAGVYGARRSPGMGGDGMNSKQIPQRSQRRELLSFKFVPRKTYGGLRRKRLSGQYFFRSVTILPEKRSSVRHVECGPREAGQRVDNFLIRELGGVPKSHVYRLLRSGQVRING